MKMNTLDLSGKRILFILPQKQFFEQDYDIPRAYFEVCGADSYVACSSHESAIGMLGEVVRPDILKKEVVAEDYSAIILVGGTGSREFWHCNVVHKILKQGNDGDKIIGATSQAYITLVNAGILEEKPASAYPSPEGYLKWNDVNNSFEGIDVSENIVTARGPEVVKEFSLAVARLLCHETKEENNKMIYGN